MARIFNDEQLAGISEFISDMIETFGRPCQLFYQPIFVQNSNDLLLADQTYVENVGIHGGPIQGNQYNEGASGAIASQETETVSLVIDWTVKDNVAYAAQNKLPYAIIKTHGYLGDYNKIQRAIEMQVNLPGGPINMGRYKLLGQGGDIFSIVQNKYFMCYWERIS